MISWLNTLILTLLGMGLLRMSWQKWVNITVDYGRELYTPWRIACGQVLYKDMASLFGPFPSYWNALLFKIFGVSIMTLAAFNTLLVACITALVYRFFSYTTDKLVALFASAAFLILFAFQQSNLGWDQGNFSYICPYTYSVTYALFFSLWALDLFAAYGRSGRDVFLGAVGILIGFTALCRFEIFVFFTVAVVLGLISKGIIEHWPFKRFLKSGAMLLAGFCVPVGIAYLYFSAQLPFSQVAPSILGFNGHWPQILKVDYYQFTIGLNHPWYNFKIMLATAAWYGLAVIFFKFLCMGTDLFENKGRQWQGGIFVLLGLAGVTRVADQILAFHHRGVFKGLPLAAIFMAGYLSWLLWRRPRDGDKLKRLLPLWVMAVWGLFMITKVFLNTNLHSEGFVYAMPAAMLFVVLFLGFVPQYFKQAYPRNGHWARLLACLLMALILITELRMTALVYHSRNFHVQNGPDTIICRSLLWYPHKAHTAEIVSFLHGADKIMGKDAGFVVFPQGVMLNFLTKRPDPLPYNTFMFAEVIKFGEQEMLRSFKRIRPEYVVVGNYALPPENSLIYTGYPYDIRAWILANYHPVWPTYPGIDNTLTVYKRSE